MNLNNSDSENGEESTSKEQQSNKRKADNENINKPSKRVKTEENEEKEISHSDTSGPKTQAKSKLENKESLPGVDSLFKNFNKKLN